MPFIQDHMYFYAVLLALLFAGQWLYRKYADQIGAVDEPKGRSSHYTPTPTGLGVLVVIALLSSFLVLPISHDWTFCLGIAVLGGVSFWDDLKPTPNGIRFLLQLVVVSLMVYQLPVSLTHLDSPIILLAAVVFGVGVLNAYNFMDGINGMFILHVFVVLLTLLAINEGLFGIERHHIAFMESPILVTALLAIVVLAFVNVRNQALGFLGDSGAITLAFVILYGIFQLFVKTQNYTYFILIGTFGIDTGCTVAVKLWRGESVLKPHRDFLFKRLVHLHKRSHLSISIPYALVQAISNALVLQIDPNIGTQEQIIILVGYITLMVGLYAFYYHKTSILKRALKSLFTVK